MKLITIVALMILMPIYSLAEKPASSPELIVKGKKSFEVNCTVCHGLGGKGDGPAAAALNPTPRNLTSEPFKSGESPDQIFTTVSKGLNGTNMQGFPGLSDEERWGLVFYVLNLRGK